MKITEISIKKPISVLAIALAIVVVGIYSMAKMPVNLLPDITYPLVKVYLDWPGATPEEIEDNIADVIEPKMATVDNLDYLETNISEGRYILLVNFTYDADRDVAYQDVLAKIGLVKKRLPSDAEEPQVIKADPSGLPVMDILITSTSWDMVKLRDWAENTLQNEFTSIEGTAGTEVSGGKLREIKVLLQPYQMDASGVTIEKVIQRIKEENLDLSAGLVTTGKREFTLRTLSRFRSVDEISNIIIKSDKEGGTVYLKDIAKVSDDAELQRIATKQNGIEGIKLSVFKQATANTVKVEEAIQKKLVELRKRLPKGISLGVSYDQATYIRSANKGVQDTAILAGILVLFVTIIFLSGWKRVLMIAITLPVSLLGSFAVMQMLGFSFNILSLGGLVVSFTVILDNSLVVLENISRLEDNNDSHPILNGVLQVAKPIFFSTITFMAIFLPFLMVPGLTSLLFKELVITISVVVGFSLLTALTLIPALSVLFYGADTPHPEIDHTSPKLSLSDRVMNVISGVYGHILRFILRRLKIITLLGIIGMLLVSLNLAKKLGSEFLPKADDGMITIKVKLPTGSSVGEMDKVIKNIESSVDKLPNIESYSSIVGGSVWGLVTSEIANVGSVSLQLVPKSKRTISTDKFVAKYRKNLMKSAKYPGAKVKVFHSKMKGIRSTGTYDIEVELYAPKSVSLPKLYRTAQNIMGKVRIVEGVSNLDLSMDLTKPEYHFIANRARCSDLGITPTRIATSLKTLVDGKIASEYEDNGFYYPIRVRVDENDIKGIADVNNLPLLNGIQVISLSDLGTVKQKVGPVRIDRKNQLRLIKITGSVSQGDVGKVSQKVYEKLDALDLGDGMFIKAGGQAQAMKENNAAMKTVILLGIFFALILLVIQFESLKLPLLIISAIPFVLTGFVIALYFTNVPVGVTAIIGLVVLLGMLLNHWVLVVSFMEELRKTEGHLVDAVVKAASMRLRPIIMTFLTDVLGLMPFLLNIGDGIEMLRPLGIAVIGGITWSLMITFVYVPVVYYIIFYRREKKNNKL